MPERAVVTLADYVESSLDVLRREAPRHFAELRRQLGARVVSVTAFGGEQFALDLGATPPWVKSSCVADLLVRLEDGALAAFAGGELSFEAALDSGSASIQGDVDDVVHFTEALRAWLHGALRSPSFPGLELPTLKGARE